MGLGYRAGNACLEQVAVLLERHGVQTGIHLDELHALARLVAHASGIPLYRLAPIIGELAFHHTLPSHREHPGEFEAFTPDLVGATRHLIER